MKTFTIYPDKARALGNVMNNNSNVEDMLMVNSNVIALVDDENPLTDDEGNEYVPSITVDYDNLPFPLFEMGVLSSLYSTSLTLSASSINCYVGDSVNITATLRDNDGALLDGVITFSDRNSNVNVNTTNGVASRTYSFDSPGNFIITARSLRTNRHHAASASKTITVSKKPISISVSGINSTTTYVAEIPFTVELSSNGQPVPGLQYSIMLDGKLFDTGTSTANGESFTISGLDIGEHTLEVIYPGNNMYNSCTESIEFEDGKIPEVFITKSNSTILIEVYYNTNPIEGMALSGTLRGPNNINLNLINLTTDSSGEVSLTLSGYPSGSYTLTITTPAQDGFLSTTVSKTFTL